MVPVALAVELHRYLRGHHIWSSPPQPCLTEFDCIEIDRKMDADMVQGLLKSWS
jgi:hypothetical protein